MKKVIFTVAAVLGFTSFANAGTFKGKCVEEAVNAAIQKWADVPNPSDDLYYVPVSAQPVQARSTTYEVTLGIYDLNGYMAFDNFVVQVKDLSSCEAVSVESKK